MPMVSLKFNFTDYPKPVVSSRAKKCKFRVTPSPFNKLLRAFPFELSAKWLAA